MKLYTDKRIQITLMILYPLILGTVFVWVQPAFWALAVVTMLVYCGLWKNLLYMLGSNLLLLAASLLLWAIPADYMQMGSVDKTRDWLPFVYILYTLFAIVPPLILVPVRNLLLRKERRRAS
ncbi:hypothetical protein QWJ34_12160 [Saccharibacillus sp. CPCC 101409]|uniref:hypothetical protein n=1 Tax=Saccharibacillus sp. CPCC 101409 TaxID=3058041 RepID=UPI0026740759|nr:hypothetical protein [Saccharibacillus sp. CPCC 101409]MDO3410516.1 hypothetical protein [Saccharibacillus sp. CPCC 101409]